MSRGKKLIDPETGKKMLSNIELMQLKVDELDNKAAKLAVLLEQKNVECLMLKQKLMAQEVSIAQGNLKTLMDFQAGTLERKRENVRILQKKHNLADGWGFDPDSGEIKEGSE